MTWLFRLAQGPLMALLFLTLAAGPAAAAGLEAAWNPHPDGEDLILPMPCGAGMVFRAVGVEADGYLWDLETLFGCDGCESPERDYYDRRYPAAISGPLSLDDLPAAWRDRLPRADAGRYFYYLIGKYEVSNFQWRAVMENQCPAAGAPLDPDGAKPKTGLTWQEANHFTRAYMEWLLANAPESLPRFAGDEKNTGYVRLPTETEWEYAARGGQAVSRLSLREEEFFPLAPGAEYADYAVFGGGDLAAGPAAIGSRRPNPLGLYDTAGNAAEMVMDTFRFSLGGRLHGSAGGFTGKGGGYASSQPEIMPGKRNEFPLFTAGGPFSSPDLGLRLALSGINTPAGNRPEALTEEWKRAGEGAGLLPSQGRESLAEVDRLIAASRDPVERKNLESLRGVFKDTAIALERVNALAAERLIRGSAFMVEAARNSLDELRRIENLTRVAREARDSYRVGTPHRVYLEHWAADLEKLLAGLKRFSVVAFYRENLEQSLQYPEAMFTAQLERIEKEYEGDSLAASRMRQCLDLYRKHLALSRKGKRAGLTNEAVLKDIEDALPDSREAARALVLNRAKDALPPEKR